MNTRIEWVQARPAESETGRPVHAVLAVLDDDAGTFALETRTHCDRLTVDELTPIETPLAPFANADVADRCATCQMLIAQAAAGQPAGVPRMTIPRVEIPPAPPE